VESISVSEADTAERVEIADSIDDVAEAWDELADAREAGPFVRPGWFRAWQSAFGEHELRVLVATRSGSPVGVLPLALRGSRVMSPTNWHTPAYGPVAKDDQAERALARHIPSILRSTVDLSFLDPSSAFAGELAGVARADSARAISRPILRSPYIELDGTFADYEATRESKFRRELARRTKRLAELGDVDISFHDGTDALDSLLTEGFAVEGSGWKTERGTAIAADPAADRFYRDAARWAAGRGWLRLGFLRLDGRCLAFSYTVVLNDVVHVVKVGFDPEYRKFAPGTILTRANIERAFGHGAVRYDFLGDDDRYKLDWASEVKERVRTQLFARTPLGLASFAAWRYGRPAVKRALTAARERTGGRAG
jgi:CelD/BcsL family acetyltransferase involved in cellulose biosynthesis